MIFLGPRAVVSLADLSERLPMQCLLLFPRLFCDVFGAHALKIGIDIEVTRNPARDPVARRVRLAFMALDFPPRPRANPRVPSSPAEDGSAPEATFEGRTVNGWVI